MKYAALIAAAVIGAALPAAVDAQPRWQRDDPAEFQNRGRGEGRDGPPRRGGFERQGQTISMSQAINIARGRVPGRVLDAGMAGANYRVRLMTADGRVVDFVIDAGSGAILRGG
ncbi:MAG TPA: PepSY domain-containing protein [Phenylobacterium sp.]|nr:PepSY domain-containing protein [Phenylobacterium sp.]